jgi:hypothetical protein
MRTQFRVIGGIPYLVSALKEPNVELRRCAVKVVYALSVDGMLWLDLAPTRRVL